MTALDGIPSVGGVPNAPIPGPGPVGKVRERGKDRERRFEDELEDDADDPKPNEPAREPRREPHPPADEDSGNQLDVVA